MASGNTYLKGRILHPGSRHQLEYQGRNELAGQYLTYFYLRDYDVLCFVHVFPNEPMQQYSPLGHEIRRGSIARSDYVSAYRCLGDSHLYPIIRAGTARVSCVQAYAGMLIADKESPPANFLRRVLRLPNKIRGPMLMSNG